MNIVRVFVSITIISVLFCSTKISATEGPEFTDREKTHLSDRVQTTFIENQGEMGDKQIAFFANLSNGIVYVKKNGIVSYDFLPTENNNPLINEKFTSQKIVLEPSEPPPADVIALYKQRGFLQDDFPANYYRLSLGEIYKGVKLELRAFTDSLDKLLTLSSVANPEIIHIKLEGIKDLKIDKSGLLEMMLPSGGVIKLTKPFAYQGMEDERKSIEISYRIYKDTTYGFEVGKYDKTKPLMIHLKTLKGEGQ